MNVKTRRRGQAVVFVATILAFASAGSAAIAAPQSHRVGVDPVVSTTDAPPPAPGTPPANPRIINGVESPVGQFPWLGVIPEVTCGVSVIAPMWVVTAAHCLYDRQGSRTQYVSNTTVRLGSISKSSGGRVHSLSQILVHPQYDTRTLHNDVAVMQLTSPTSVMPIAMSASANNDAALAPVGAQTWVAGWGNTNPVFSQPGNYPDRQRYTNLWIQNEQVCRQSAYATYTPTSICAWADNTGSCHGDSGGPLMAYSQSTAYLVGLVSYGMPDANNRYCANGTYATVFTRVSSFATWIEDQIEVGPHASNDAFIRQAFRDFAGREATASEMSLWRARLTSSHWTWDMLAEMTRSTPWETQARSSIRLYRASFLRDPEPAGLKYWIDQRRAGKSLTWAAGFFANSQEFRTRYGSLNNSQFVDRVYRNVLGRAPDRAGLDFWVDRLSRGTPRGTMMAQFSEVQEHRQRTDVRVDAIAIYYGMLGQAPAAGELSWMMSQTLPVVARWILHSPAYSSRFR